MFSLYSSPLLYPRSLPGVFGERTQGWMHQAPQPSVGMAELVERNDDPRGTISRSRVSIWIAVDGGVEILSDIRICETGVLRTENDSRRSLLRSERFVMARIVEPFLLGKSGNTRECQLGDSFLGFTTSQQDLSVIHGS